MQEHHFDLETTDGDMPTWVMRPDGDGPFPVVLLLMDAPGMRQETRDMAMRLATSGYYVMTSQLYYRTVREYCLFDDSEGGQKRMYELMDGLSNAMAAADAGAMLRHAEADPEADATKAGVAGYCMSGPFAIAIAAAHPSSIRAAASLHGVRLVTEHDDSPHRMLGDVAGEIYVAHAELDTHIGMAELAEFENALTASGTAGRVEYFADIDHGFTYPTRGLIYNRLAAETHWERLLDLFARTLTD